MNQRTLWTTGLALPAALLGGALAWAWLTPELQLKNTAWIPPQPLKADIQALVPPANVPEDQSKRDEQQLLEMQERPLFVISRRPPPPPPPPPPPDKKAQQEVPDIWNQARVTGVFEGAITGIIFSLEGKERRLLLNQNLAGWKLQSVQGGSVVLESNGRTRVLQLVKAVVDKGPNIPPGMRVPPSQRTTVQARPQDTPSHDGAQVEEPPQAVFGGTPPK
ncbi:hypothetical protein ACUTR7_05195 [Delftia sp. NA_296.1]|uniref:hypothetical protein n=1 Tax=Delftia TaxID=80865 RepID=UPI0012FE5BB1|nr:hypothetical protein [Delftia acidovorans]